MDESSVYIVYHALFCPHRPIFLLSPPSEGGVFEALAQYPPSGGGIMALWACYIYVIFQEVYIFVYLFI